jgi:hypothetical protein
MSINQQVERDAVAFGKFIKDGGAWHFAMLAARSTFKGRANTVANSALAELGKVTTQDFAEMAGCNDVTVMRYRNKWDEKANEYGLPLADDLKPGDEVDLSTLPKWPGTDNRDGTEERHVSKSVARERAKAAIKADPTLVSDVIKTDQKVAEAAWDAIEEKAIERANDAALEAIQRGGCVTPAMPKPSKLGTAWEEAMTMATRGEAIQALEEFVDAIEAGAKKVAANGNPQDNEGEQIRALADRIADVAAGLYTLTLEEVSK